MSFCIFPSLGIRSRDHIGKEKNWFCSHPPQLLLYIYLLFKFFNTFSGDSFSGLLGFLGFLFYNSRWILDFALGFSAPLNSSAST
jgi:hypothetical protein